MLSFDSVCFILGVTPGDGRTLLRAGMFPERGDMEAVEAWIHGNGGETLPPLGPFHEPHEGYVFPAHPRYVDGTCGDHVRVHAAGDGVRGAPADTGPADGARRAADRAKGGTACERYRRYVAYLRCLDFHRFLNAGQRLRDAVRLGKAREPDGSYDGDGIPRTAGGHPYEPLEWGEVRRSGTD